MSSKSLRVIPSTVGYGKYTRTFDFTEFYKSTSELPKRWENNTAGSSADTQLNNVDISEETKLKKKKKKSKRDSSNVSEAIVKSSSINSNVKLKGILKVSPAPEDCTKDTASTNQSNRNSDNDIKDGTKEAVTKPNKRSKSCSFMLEDTQEIAVKKPKSEGSFVENRKMKDSRKEHQKSIDGQNGNQYKTKIYRSQKHSSNNRSQDSEDTKALEKLTKRKKLKRLSQDTEQTAEENTEQATRKKPKNSKKKRHQEMELYENETKAEVKTDILTENLENLNIGDNAHTLTNLLDEMAVVDKSKIEKKQKRKDKKKIGTERDKDLEKEENEKVKWSKRKWNKDKKGGIENENLDTTVVIENLPISIMLTYKKLLTDHFVKYGLIKNIGIAEVYPTEESKPVFTTTIKFYSDGAATEALNEDNATFEGSSIRVKRPLPATETTIVLRSYSELNEQTVCSLFTGIGKIRSIRLIIKGRKSLSTAFIEFAGTESVEKALQKAAHIKIGKKKVHVARYQPREKKLKSDEGQKESDSE